MKNRKPKPIADFTAKVLAKIKAMTPEEGFKSLQDAGIYTKGGKLSRNYAPKTSSFKPKTIKKAVDPE